MTACRLRVAASALVCATFFGADACKATDWSLEVGLSEKIDYDTNIELVEDPDGYALGSISTLNADLIGLTPVSKFEILANLGYQSYTGPGATSELDGFFPNFDANYSTHSRDTTIDLGASYSIQDLTSATIDETGLIQSTDANQNTITVDGGITQKIDRNNTVAFKTIGTRVTFSPQTSDLVPYDDLNNTVTFTRLLSPTLDGDIILGLEFYDPDQEPDIFNTIYSAEAGLTRRFNRRLTGRIGAGINVVHSKHKFDAASGDSDPGSDEVDVQMGPLFNAGFDYNLRRTSITFNISEQFTPTDFGDIQEVRQVTLSVGHQLTEMAKVGFSAIYSSQIPSSSGNDDNADEPTTALSLSPTFDYEFARDWRLQLGYRLLTEKFEDGNATSNDFFLVVSRNYFVIP